MKLSEIKNEAALDVLAEIIDPATKILGDPKIKEVIKNENKLGVAKYILKNHKTPILEILAAIDCVPVDKYECNIITLPLKVLDLLNDDELMSFFTSQALTEAQTFSTGATESTEATEKA